MAKVLVSAEAVVANVLAAAAKVVATSAKAR